MPASDALKNKRDYMSQDKPETGQAERSVELMPEELKALGVQEGEEVVVQVSGRVENGCIYVNSVSMPKMEKTPMAPESVMGPGARPPMFAPKMI